MFCILLALFALFLRFCIANPLLPPPQESVLSGPRLSSLGSPPGGVEQLIQRYPGIDVRSIVRRERIGEGTFAGIYRATLDGHTYAVKSLHSIEASEMHLRNAQPADRFTRFPPSPGG